MKFPDLTQVLEPMSAWIEHAAPQFLVAVAWVLLGWVLASVGRLVTRKALGAIWGGVEARIERHGSLRASGLWQASSIVIGSAVYWTILLCFVTVAVQELSVPFAAEVLRALAYFLPKVLLALVLAFLGASLGSIAYQWISGVATTAGVSNPGVLGRMAQAGILGVTLIVAVQLVGLEGSIFVSITTVVLGATLGGMALAFGLGSAPVVSNIMASYYASKSLNSGDTVRIGGIEGDVQEVTSTSIVVDAGTDRIHVPARKYCDEECVVIGGGQ